ncbi:MAG: amino acid ABC transporter substrate-binding protein [bacterium]|nr:amino acid ABC transporter substrate-binding protein [bacterium]
MKQILLLVLFNIFISSVYADTIIIAADLWCPYNCKPSSQQPGFMIEIAKYAFKEKGHKIIYKDLPYARAIEYVRYGKLNGLIGADKDEVPDFIFPKNEQAVLCWSFFVKTGDPWKFNGLKSLFNTDIGIIGGYNYGSIISDYKKTNPKYVETISAENALELNIKKILEGRITATVEDIRVMKYYLKKTGRVGLLSEAGQLQTEVPKLYIAFSPKIKKSSIYAKILSDGIADMRKSGMLRDILAKYGLTDWKK